MSFLAILAVVVLAGLALCVAMGRFIAAGNGTLLRADASSGASRRASER
jgi:hypothetical protein